MIVGVIILKVFGSFVGSMGIMQLKKDSFRIQFMNDMEVSIDEVDRFSYLEHIHFLGPIKERLARNNLTWSHYCCFTHGTSRAALHKRRY